jgi:hypothetical protein
VGTLLSFTILGDGFAQRSLARDIDVVDFREVLPQLGIGKHKAWEVLEQHLFCTQPIYSWPRRAHLALQHKIKELHEVGVGPKAVGGRP